MTSQTQSWTRSQKTILAGLLLAQFAAAYFIGTGHWLTNEAHAPFPPIAMTAVVPVILFLLAYVLSARFRGFVLSQDLRRLTILQHWRVVGFAFLPLYTFGILPGLFALPAGLGDVAVGLAAAFVVARMDRDPNYATTSGFVLFHLMGLLDFTIAMSTAALAGGAFPELISNGLTSAQMDVWPLNIFPSFVVPAFIILQVSALLKVRDLRKSQLSNVKTSLQSA